MPLSTLPTTVTGLAAVAAAAAGPSDAEIAAAAATPAASPAPPAETTQANTAPQSPATDGAVAAPETLTASAALELAALALPSVRAQLGELSTAASAPGASEATYRAACLKIAAGPSSATTPMRTQSDTTAVSAPGGDKTEPVLASADDIYADRQKVMSAG